MFHCFFFIVLFSVLIVLFFVFIFLFFFISAKPSPLIRRALAGKRKLESFDKLTDASLPVQKELSLEQNKRRRMEKYNESLPDIFEVLQDSDITSDLMSDSVTTEKGEKSCYYLRDKHRTSFRNEKEVKKELMKVERESTQVKGDLAEEGNDDCWSGNKQISINDDYDGGVVAVDEDGVHNDNDSKKFLAVKHDIEDSKVVKNDIAVHDWAEERKPSVKIEKTYSPVKVRRRRPTRVAMQRSKARTSRKKNESLERSKLHSLFISMDSVKAEELPETKASNYAAAKLETSLPRTVKLETGRREEAGQREQHVENIACYSQRKRQERTHLYKVEPEEKRVLRSNKKRYSLRESPRRSASYGENEESETHGFVLVDAEKTLKGVGSVYRNRPLQQGRRPCFSEVDVEDLKGNKHTLNMTSLKKEVKMGACSNESFKSHTERHRIEERESFNLNDVSGNASSLICDSNEGGLEDMKEIRKFNGNKRHPKKMERKKRIKPVVRFDDEWDQHIHFDSNDDEENESKTKCNYPLRSRSNHNAWIEEMNKERDDSRNDSEACINDGLLGIGNRTRTSVLRAKTNDKTSIKRFEGIAGKVSSTYHSDDIVRQNGVLERAQPTKAIEKRRKYNEAAMEEEQRHDLPRTGECRVNVGSNGNAFRLERRNSLKEKTMHNVKRHDVFKDGRMDKTVDRIYDGLQKQFVSSETDVRKTNDDDGDEWNQNEIEKLHL